MNWSFAGITRPAQNQSPLLELPAELREAIFELAVVSEKPIVTFKLDQYQKDSYQEARQPAITRVSRQVRSESLPIYYDCNNFVIHTEGAKSDDASRWLMCNEKHLNALRHLTFWIRYIPFVHERLSSQGALGISLARPVKRGCWKVDDRWKWITVVRKPQTLASDAEFLIGHFKKALVNESTVFIGSEAFVEMIEGVRKQYAKEKSV